MPLVCLKPTWPTETFRRTLHVKDKKGKTLEVKKVEFRKQHPEEVSADEVKALSHDIGKALFEVALDEKGRIRYLDPSDPAAQVPSAPSTPAE